MALRSRGQADQRRRRVLLDESRESTSVYTPTKGRKRKRRYAEHALTDAQPRVTDALPQSWRRVVVLLALLAMTDGLVALCAYFRPVWQAATPEVPLAVLKDVEYGSLGRLLLAMQLMGAAGLSLLIFSVRRHRLDDLRGTYQCWLWAATIGVVASLFTVCELRPLLEAGIRAIPGLPSISANWLWPLILAAVMLPVVLRLVIEMRRVRVAQVALVLAAMCCFIAEGTARFESLAQYGGMISAAALLLAGWFLLSALLLYGRRVKRDALHLDQPGKRKKVKKEAEELLDEQSDDASLTSRRVDPPSAMPKPNQLGAAIADARAQNSEQRPASPLSQGSKSRDRNR
jgi:hypothetical protein